LKPRLTRVRRHVLALFLGTALVALHAPAARADLVATVNAIRTEGCGKKLGPQPALRSNAALSRAAEALAAGRSFKDAMAESGYRAAQSAMLEVAGDSAAAISESLASRGCKEIAVAAYRELGVATRPGRAWVVLGAPLAPPAEADGATVSGRVLALVNAARADARRCGWKKFKAAPPLVLSEILGRAARIQADDMARHGSLSHSGSDGSTPAERATRAGYRWKLVGENIAAGQPAPEQVVAEWLESPGHCSNIMDPAYAEMGVAFAYEARSEKGVYWSQVFGTPAR
jgi:uncharacterized protein YkwD